MMNAGTGYRSGWIYTGKNELLHILQHISIIIVTFTKVELESPAVLWYDLRKDTMSRRGTGHTCRGKNKVNLVRV